MAPMVELHSLARRNSKVSEKSSADGTNQDKEDRLKLVISLVAAIAASIDPSLTGSAMTAAQIEAENNYFGQKSEGFRASEQKQFDAVAAACGPGNPTACARARELAGLSNDRDAGLVGACATQGSSLCSAAMKLAQEMGNIVFFDAKGIPIAVPADSPSIQATRDPRDGTWHYTISASVAEGLAIDSGGGALSGVGSALRGLFKPSVADVALGAKATGKVIAEFGPMNQGPLPKGIADTFRSGTYSEVVTQQPTTLYRVYGGTAQELGGYWTATKPAGPVQSIIDSALKPEWGNTATNVVKIEVPIGTKYFEGVAAPQGGLVGGGNQVLFPKDFKIDTSWIRQ